MVLKDKAYNFLKWLCLIALPAISVFFATLDGVFCWGYTDIVTTVIAAVEAFLGTLIGISTYGFYKD